MTPEQLYEIAFVVAAARTHATDAEYVKEIDPLTAKLIDAVQEAWRERDEARAEVERMRGTLDTANALLAEALKELDTIEAITVSPTDTDGLIDLIKRMKAHLE